MQPTSWRFSRSMYRNDALPFTVSGAPRPIRAGDVLPNTPNPFSTGPHEANRRRALLKFDHQYFAAWHPIFDNCIPFEIPMSVNGNLEPLNPVNTRCEEHQLTASKTELSF